MAAALRVVELLSHHCARAWRRVGEMPGSVGRRPPGRVGGLPRELGPVGDPLTMTLPAGLADEPWHLSTNSPLRRPRVAERGRCRSRSRSTSTSRRCSAGWGRRHRCGLRTGRTSTGASHAGLAESADTIQGHQPPDLPMAVRTVVVRGRASQQRPARVLVHGWARVRRRGQLGDRPDPRDLQPVSASA
jgi:hypothetical protein